MLYNVIRPDSFPEIVFAHSYTKKNYYTRINATQPHIEIAYIKSGTLVFSIDNIDFTIQEGSFLIFPHNHPAYLSSINDDLHIHYTVAFDVCKAPVLQNGLIKNGQNKNGQIIVPLIIPPCPKTERLFVTLNKIIKTYHSGDPNSSSKAGCMAVELLCDLSSFSFSNLNATLGSADHIYRTYSERIKSYIKHNLTKNISLNEIAAAIGKSPNHLNTVFRETNGITIRQYINLERTKKAAELIIKNRFTLKQAASAVGIMDEKYFSRMFKKQFGVSVSEFKNNSFESTFSMIDPNKEIFE